MSDAQKGTVKADDVELGVVNAGDIKKVGQSGDLRNAGGSGLVGGSGRVNGAATALRMVAAGSYIKGW